MNHFLRRALALLFVLGSLSVLARAGSETPPVGPPWKRDFAAAQTEAAQKGLPIFVYLTKTV